MGMLSQMRCQSLYIHLAMDVRKGLGSVAVDNAALSTSKAVSACSLEGF